MKILICADRQGWALDRISRPLSEQFDNIDMSYKFISPKRFLASGYSVLNSKLGYTKELGMKYNIIHFFHPQSGAIDARALPSSIRKIATRHSERDDKIDWEAFDDIVCPTQYVLEQMTKKKLKARLHYIPYGVDINSYKPKEINLKSNCVGYVGRVVKWKRFDLVLKSVIEAKLKLLGCGYIEDSFIFKKEDRMGMAREWWNFLPEKNIVDFYARMNLFMCLSMPNIETGTLPILEAMACGIPVISTRIGWAKDNCLHGTNIWFIEENEIKENKVSGIIKDIYNKPDMRTKLKENALKLIQDFSIEKYCDKIMNIYKL